MSNALRWVTEERAGHAGAKWPAEHQDAITRGENDIPWRRWLLQYLDRALLLGLDTPNGKQALGKFVVTAVAMLESVERVHGPLPAPGHPSGEIEEWEL